MVFLVVHVPAGSPADVSGLRYGDRWIGFDEILELANPK